MHRASPFPRGAPVGYSACGHHRYQAAVELFTGKHEVSVQVEDYTDEQMAIAMADENAGDETALEAQCDTVIMVQEKLQDGTFKCRGISAHDGQKIGRGRPHECGSEHCISAFLGDKNWSRSKVNRLLTISDLPPDVTRSVTPEDVHTVGVERNGASRHIVTGQLMPHEDEEETGGQIAAD